MSSFSLNSIIANKKRALEQKNGPPGKKRKLYLSRREIEEQKRLEEVRLCIYFNRINSKIIFLRKKKKKKLLNKKVEIIYQQKKVKKKFLKRKIKKLRKINLNMIGMKL